MDPTIVKKTNAYNGDIIKQVFYRYFLSKEYNQKNQDNVDSIVNAFLMPRGLSNEEKIVYFGKHTLLKDHRGHDIGMVLCFFIDFFSLREAYLQRFSTLGDDLLTAIINTYKQEIGNKSFLD